MTRTLCLLGLCLAISACTKPPRTTGAVPIEGYPPGEQGKALAGMDHVLSQVALHHMYDAAFKAGAPLQVERAVLRPGVPKSSPWLVMQVETFAEFNISPKLIDRFNNWQAQLTPGSLLEDALAREAELITAWRIYTFITDKANLPNLPFYTALGSAKPDQSKDMSEDEVAAFKRLHELDMARDVALREQKPLPVENEFLRNRRANDEVIKANYTHRTGLPVTINTRKTFEPMLDKRQIDRGMDEFVRDYNGAWGLSPVEEIWSTNIINGLFGGLLYLTNEQDEAEEYARMRAGGKSRHDALINQYGGLIDGKAINLFLLFDDQIHDSRAWFMNSAVNEREVFTDYFRYRAVFFDDESSKRLSLVATAGQILGVAIAVASIGLTIKRHDPRYLIGLLVPSLGIPVLRGKVGMPSIGAYDTLTGFALPMLEGLNSLRGFTQETGKVGAVAKLLPLAPMINEFNATTPEFKAVLVANDAALAQERPTSKAPRRWISPERTGLRWRERY